MRRSLDIINVVDVESTCWEGGAPPGEVSEIIEIGLCELRVGDGRLLESVDLLVRPQRSSVSEFCTRLTTLTPEVVDGGVPFAEACALLEARHAARQRVWASYGEYDRGMFERQCRAFGVPYPFGTRHINVKTLVALTLGLPAEVGMPRALELLGLPLEGTHHRGGDDARNIARILGRVLTAGRRGLKGGSSPGGER